MAMSGFEIFIAVLVNLFLIAGVILVLRFFRGGKERAFRKTFHRRMAPQLYDRLLKDKDFRDKVKSGKGFCLPHYKLLLESAKKHLSTKQCAVFARDINELMMKNMDRMLDEVQWFAQKFDYRNKDASWKNSKDAVPRAIEKFVSYENFK